MNILPYNLFTEVNDLNSGWIKIYQTLDEGINYTSDEDEGPLINIKFDKDSSEDVVKLKNPVNLRMAKFRETGIKTWAGYKVEQDNKKFTNEYRSEFLDYVKKLDSISNKDLKALINHTYPSELKKLGGQVKILFATGSSDTLSIRIAEALKELYHHDADVVDVMKSYYGVDAKNTIDWDKYDKADARTKKMINSYLNKISNNFTGNIKKSSGLQSGARSLLKAGHSIDDYITSNVIDTQRKWNKYKGSDMRMRAANQPYYILVDDVVIGGSTTKKIFELYIEAMQDAISKNMYNKLNINLDYIKSSTKGYVLFSYAKRHNITNKN